MLRERLVRSSIPFKNHSIQSAEKTFLAMSVARLGMTVVHVGVFIRFFY